MKNFSHKNLRGFTLIEMVVSIAIFSTVLLVAMSAFLSVVNGDRKSRVMRIATDNLNLALEDMSRKIKTGDTYNCGGVGFGTSDCTAGARWSPIFAFTDQGGIRTMYKRGIGPGPILNGVASTSGCGEASFGVAQGCILREGADGFSILTTSPEINIVSLKFYVTGSTFADAVQPSVLIAIDGSLGSSAVLHAGNAGFKIQTVVTQRAYDK